MHAVNRAFRTQTPVEGVLESVFEEVWTRKLELPQQVRDQLCQAISQPYLASTALNLPVMGTTTTAFKTKFPTRRLKSICTNKET